MKCPTCGQMMSSTTDKEGHTYYYCYECHEWANGEPPKEEPKQSPEEKK